MSTKPTYATNPENLIDQILRNRIYNHTYYKQQCFGLTAETLIDKAVELESIGGTYGGNLKPSNFVCLLFKMLQIQIQPEIIQEFIKNRDYKYLTALGAFYLRLTGKPTEIYQTLEPLYSDYRKLRKKIVSGQYIITHMDEFIEDLLTKEFCCDIALPFLPKRILLENQNILSERETTLDEIDLHKILKEEKEEEQKKEGFKLKFKKKEEDLSSSEEEDLHWNPEKKDKKPFVWKGDKQDEEEDEQKNGKSDTLSIEETNELRKKIGLAPLK
jgi:pre-mRNA-splicing factor 38A